MVFIYILELENKKYYVGRTTNPNFRLEQHFNNSGSQWTKKYKPLKILELIPNCDNYDEEKYTIKYMEKYGINNVRGGSFCEIKLNDNNLITLNQIINSVTDKCYICGDKGHYANDCKKQSTKKDKIPISIPIPNPNEKCDCVTSYFSNHRRSKCLLNNMLSYFDDEDEDINKIIKL
jgi:predicted GIY-YIG superfamily endonuclease